VVKKFDYWSKKIADPPESVYGEMISIDGQTQLLVKVFFEGT